jgi:GNAT superfamily N-acetyltransferase
MNVQEILAQLDDDRRALEEPLFERDPEPEVVRHYPLSGRRGFIAWSGFPEASLEAAIDRQIECFRGRAREFEWKAYDHDGPPNLRTALREKGLRPEEPESFMVTGAAAAAALPDAPGAEVRRLCDPSDLEPLRWVMEAAWGSDYRWLIAELGEEMRADPERLAVYLASIDGQPASCGWVRLPRGGHIATLWGGSTAPECRGRGLYRALIAVRACEALERGFAWLGVDAGPMSRPILERTGFSFVTGVQGFIWPPRSGMD